MPSNLVGLKSSSMKALKHLQDKWKFFTAKTPSSSSRGSNCHINNPKVLQSESVEVGNIIGLQCQLLGTTVDPFRRLRN